MAQVECLTSLTNIIREAKDRKSDNTPGKIYLCRSTVPALIGLCRSMGRFCTQDPPLMCRIFPKPEHPLGDKMKMNNIDDSNRYNTLTKKSSFTHYRSIIPRSLSGNLNAVIHMDNSQKSIDTTDIAYNTDSLKKSTKMTYSNPALAQYDSSRYFFVKYG